MKFDVQTVNRILEISDAFKAPSKMMSLMLNDKKREETFEKFLEIETDMSYEWFHEYFQDEQAERKSKKQDFTPSSISKLIGKMIANEPGIYYEPAAGTGSMLIAKWNDDRINNPMLNISKDDLGKIFKVLLYDPRNYWYQVEELSDRAYPFLIFNMAIRGMNGVAIQCNSLTREAKRAYFIRNDSDNYLGFSEVIEIPRNNLCARVLNVNCEI